MKKTILSTFVTFLFLIGCNSDESIETLVNENLSFQQKKGNEMSLTTKIATTFNKMMQTKEITAGLLSSIIEDDITMLNNITFKSYVFEDHAMMLTDYVFEDNIMMLTNSTLEREEFPLFNEGIFEDDIIVRFNYNFEDNIAKLVDHTIIEDNIAMRAITIRDYVLKEDTTFEDLFNAIYKELYPQEKTTLEAILETYPKLFFSINTSSLYAPTLTPTYPTSVSVISTELCANNAIGYDEVILTLIDDSTGVNVLENNGFSSVELYFVSNGNPPILRAVYDPLSYNPNFNIVSNGGGIFAFNNQNNTSMSILTEPLLGEYYYLKITYPYSSNIPAFDTNQFKILDTDITDPYFNLYYKDKSYVDFTDSNFKFTNYSSNNRIYATSNFFANYAITFDPRPSIGVTRYELKLTETDTGNIQYSVLFNITTDYVVDLKQIFNIVHDNGFSGTSDEYILEMTAYGCGAQKIVNKSFTIGNLNRF